MAIGCRGAPAFPAKRYWRIKRLSHLHRPLRALLPAVGAAILLAACATRFEEPGPLEPHATLSFPSQEAQWFAGVFLAPLEFNGRARPRHWTRPRFAVPPGPLELRLRAARENLQGSCQLSFEVEAGATYDVDAVFRDDEFTIRVARQGRSLARCVSPASLLPTPLGPPPGVPGH